MELWRYIFVALPLFAAPWAIAGDVSPEAQGKAIYRQGLLPSGLPLTATLQNGVVLKGADAACATCHRRSGFGGSEGRNTIRPIVGRMIYGQPDLADAPLHPSLERGREMVPVYTHASLARALRKGEDPNGRALNTLMPRFDLSDADVAKLEAYLRHLSAEVAPGVDAENIHFATIVAPDADPAAAKAMLDVLHGFFKIKNGGTRQETSRRSSGTERMYRAYRKWTLHEWVLTGPPAGWKKQLEDHYRRQPVFAVLSGIGAGDWQPVHTFCETAEVPCIFPNVTAPTVAGPDAYSLYFSRGLTLDAEVLAKHLAEAGKLPGPLVQVYRDDSAGRLAAQAFRDALAAQGLPPPVERRLGGDAAPAFWSALVREDKPGVLVAWLGDKDAATLGALADGGPETVYLSASLLSPAGLALPGNIRNRVRLIYPYGLPAERDRHLAQVRLWLKLRGIPASHELVQANTYFAATIAGDAFYHLLDNFSRDYFIERIEHMTSQSLFSAAYPRLSLGPGQRFASKGAYVVKGEDLVPVSGWIVP